jgi:DNA-binding transcriptional LysR family regulator
VPGRRIRRGLQPAPPLGPGGCAVGGTTRGRNLAAEQPGQRSAGAVRKFSLAHGWTPRLRTITTRLTALTWTLLDAEDLLSLVPMSVVRPWVERALLQVLPMEQAQPLEPLGLLLPSAAAKPAALLLADHVARHYAA